MKNEKTPSIFSSHDDLNQTLNVDTSVKDSPASSLDRVTQLQDHVDQLALGLFNALRLLPSSPSEEEEKAEDDGRMEQIKQLGSTVIQSMKSIEEMIHQLPGLDTTESDQIQELSQLEQLNKEAGLQFIESTKRAREWKVRAQASLKQIANDKLNYRL